MMKKIACLLLSVMIFLLPVLSQAEGFMDKLGEMIDKGNEVTITSQFIPGEGLLAAISDPQSAEVASELLSAVKLQFSSQSVDDLTQCAVRALINDQKAAEILYGKSGDELLLTSDILGNDVYAISKDELQQALETASTELSEEDKKTVERLLEMIFPTTNANQVLGDKIIALLLEMTEEATGIIESNTANTEGETLLMDGSETGKGIIVTIPKDKLGELFAEFINKFMAIPELKDAFVQVSFNGGSPEEIVQQIQNAFLTDPTLRIYVNGDKVTLVMECEVGTEAEERTMLRAETVMDMKGDGNLIMDTFSVITGEEDEKMTVRGKLDSADDHLVFNSVMTMTDDGEEMTVSTMDGNLAFTSTNNYAGLYGVFNLAVPEAETELKIELNGKGTYSEDEAKYDLTAKFCMTPDLSKPLFTVNTTLNAGLAEAYMTADNAVRLVKLSEEEMQETIEGWEKNLQMKLITVLSMLPESVLNLMIPQAQ